MLSPDNPVTFSWLVYDRVEGKVRDDWEIFKEIEAKTGVKVEFQIVSQEGLDEKRQIMIATNTATDFIQVPTQDGREHGPEKVFLNLNDYLDRAPNLKAFTRNIRKPKRWQRHGRRFVYRTCPGRGCGGQGLQLYMVCPQGHHGSAWDTGSDHGG